MISYPNSDLPARKSYSLGPQIKLIMDDEIFPSNPGRDVGLRCRETLPDIARRNEIQIYAGSNQRDRGHTLVAIPLQLTLSPAVRYLENKSPHRLLTESRSRKKRYSGQNR